MESCIPNKDASIQYLEKKILLVEMVNKNYIKNYFKYYFKLFQMILK